MSAENVIALRLALNGTSQVSAGLADIAGKVISVGVAFKAIQIAGEIAGKLVSLTQAAIDAADVMGKLAQQTGIAVEALSGLSFAAHMGDLSSEEFANALKELGKEMSKQGQQTGSLDERLMELADRFAAMPDGVAKNQIALENFGRAGLKMIPFLNQGSEAIRQQRDEAKEFGLVIDSQFATNADAFNDNLFRIKSSLNGLFLVIAREILPYLIQTTDEIIRFTKELDAAAKVSDVMTVEFRLLSKVLKESAEHPFRPWFLTFFNASNAAAASLFADSIIKSLQPVGDAIKNALSSPAGKQELINEADGVKAAKILRELIALELEFWDAKKGRKAGEDIRFADQKEEINKLLIAEDEKNSLLEHVFHNHKLELSKIDQEFAEKEVELEKRKKAQKLQIQQDFLGASSDIMGSMATIAKLYGEKGFAAWKAFAVAQAVINGAGAVLMQLGSGDPYSAPFRAVAAGIAAAAQIATIIATQPSGYAQGGYTGNGPRNEVAGPAHRGEFIFSAPETQRIGVANLQALHEGGSLPPSVSVGGAQVSIGMLNGDAERRAWLKRDPGVRKILVDMITGAKFEMGLA